MYFNIITEPWIPIRWLTGEFEEVSLRELFEKASDIEFIYTESPFEEFGILRFIIAFFMDMYQPETDKDLEYIVKKGYIDIKIFDDYVKKCEEKGNVFDIFDKEYPFYQTKYNKEIDGDKNISFINSLFYDLPSNTNHNFFYKHYKNFLYSDCVKGLLALSPFLYGMGGEGYCGGVNGDSPYYIINKMENMLNTIVLNAISKQKWNDEINDFGEHIIIPYSKISDIEWSEGPIWRRDKEVKKKEPFFNITLLEGLTFMGRRVTLMDVDEINKTVKTVSINPSSKYINTDSELKYGEKKFIYQSFWRDPFCAYTLSEDKEDKFHPNSPRKGVKLFTFKPKDGEVFWINDRFYYSKDNHKIYTPMILDKNFSKFGIENGKSLNLVVYGGFNPQGRGVYKWWNKFNVNLNLDIFNNEILTQRYLNILEIFEEVGKKIKSNIIKNINKTNYYEAMFKKKNEEIIDKVVTLNDDDFDNYLVEIKKYILKKAIECYESNFNVVEMLKRSTDTKMRDKNNFSLVLYYKERAMLIGVIRKYLNLQEGKKDGEV